MPVTTNQLFFALGGLMLTIYGKGFVFIKYYINARFDGVNQRFDSIERRLKTLVDFIVQHEGRIAVLE
jgi:hypothetical protein